MMPGKDGESQVPPPTPGKPAHPPLAGFFGEAQKTSHLDPDKVGRGPNILSSLRREKIDLGRPAADPDDPDELGDRGFVGFS